MFHVKEYRTKADRLSDLLPWAILVAPGIVLNKDGSLQCTLQFRGPDLESSTSSELVITTARLHNALKRLGSGWAFYIEARRANAQIYTKEMFFPDPISWIIDIERQELFKKEGLHFESLYYLTLQYILPTQTTSLITQWFLSENKTQVSYDKQIQFFKNNCERLFDILKDFMFELHFLNDSETLAYLHSCISTKIHSLQVPQTPAYLDALLADTPLIGGLEPKLGEYYLKNISILGFPTTSTPAILDQLNFLPFEYRWVTRFLPLDKLDAEKILRNYKKRWFAKRKGLLNLIMEIFTKAESAMISSSAIQNAQDAELALQELEGDYVRFGYYTATLTVWDTSLEKATEKIREVERVINSLGFATIAENINAVEAWLSSLPGHAYANVRMPLLHSLNLSHLIPFSATWAGQVRDNHLKGPPLFLAQTKGNTPFRFVTHIQDVGHHLIIGPTGSGKSVLLNFIALQFRRYANAQVFILDKGGSFLSATLGVNGHYYEVGYSAEKAFQPLAHIDQETERAWAHDWLLDLFENENIIITPAIKEVLWQGLNSLAAMPQNQRTLTGLRVLLQDHSLRLALNNYVMGGSYGDLLDNDMQQFHDSDWQCFDLEQLMSRTHVLPPVLAYLFHIFEKRFDGSPTVLLLDEAWLFLANKIFADKIYEWLKTLRKLNVSVIFATQSITDLLDSNIASTLLESCPNIIFLPNHRAIEPNTKIAYEKMGLNEKQIQLIANAIPKKQYYYVSPLGCSLFDIHLSPLALSFCSLQNGNKNVLKKMHAKFPVYSDFLKTYVAENGLSEIIPIIESWYA